MKFGKYLAKRQLDLPEYADHFINYKGLKKLIKRLSAPDPETLATASQQEIEKSLQDNKAAFFVQIDRELDKVNDFYVRKARDLEVRLNNLVNKKQEAYREGDLGSKSSVSYISLHEGFLRLRRDLDRLEQYVELNGTGFSKVLKKWDKRSKSHTKELYLSRQVEIQPVFHRDELSKFSDLASTSIMELEAWGDGDSVIFESSEARRDPKVSRRERDDLYHEFIRMAQVCNGDEEVRVSVKNWLQQIQQAPDAEKQVTRIFCLTVGTTAPDVALQVLYESGLADLHHKDDVNSKSCLHRAAVVGRTYVVKIAIQNSVGVNDEDSSGKTPLHYACISNQREVIKMLVDNGADLNTDDKDNFSPLLYSIVNGFEGCVEDLINAGANVQADHERDYVPLNMACHYGVYNAVRMLLEKRPTITTDAEGLYPLHIAARAGHASVIPLLQPHVDLDQLDKFNGWTALNYAASGGHVETVRALLECGASLTVVDEDGYSAMYHATWEGHVGCMGEIASRIPHDPDQLPKDNSTHAHSLQQPQHLEEREERQRTKSAESLQKSVDDMELSDIDEIPDLSLPPPIIPLRRYGHNFLDKKIILQILFDASESPIRFHNLEGSSSSAGRLTVSTRNHSDMIPRSVILPFADTDRALSFQVDSIEDFALDFEIFPTFGTQVIAKSAALSYVFNNESDSYNAERLCQLPLFDMRLKPVGELAFRFQIVKPFSGRSLEISKYDTYWKSTSRVTQQQQQQQQLQQQQQQQQQQPNAVETLSFVTDSSLTGDYARIFVCLTKDKVPVVTRQEWLLDVAAGGLQIPIGDLTFEQVLSISASGGTEAATVLKRLSQAEFCLDVQSANDGGRGVVSLEQFLKHLPLHIKLDLGVLYPTCTDATYSNLGMSSFIELNEYVDTILHVLFEHARDVRHAGGGGATNGSTTQTRGVIFSSKHPDVCSVLNWKQPNYPVLFHMNALKLHHNSFTYQSAHAFPVEDSDRRCSSVKEAATFAAGNNLLGVVCSARLLGMVPTIVDAIRAMGLVLVANRDREEESYNVQGVDGVRSRTVLSFQESIDV